MKLRQAFYGSKMNKDVDIRSLAKNEYLHAENVRIITPDGSNASTVRPAFGNTQKSTFSFGANPRWHGHEVDHFANIIRWAVKSDTGNYIVEYNVLTDTQSVILEDTRVGSANVLNFQDGYPITDMRFINDTDNGKQFMFLTDNFNEPKYYNIERAKTFGANNFIESDIMLLKAPPLEAPVLTLGNTLSEEENNIERKFVSFAYRYEYEDGEYSALSPFSRFGFSAKAFSYDYSSSTNNSMFNLFNKVDVKINSGSKRVVGIDLIFKEAGSNTAYIAEKIKKADKGWLDNSEYSVEFVNSKIYQVLGSTQLSRIFDNVPRWAKGLEIIKNRPVFGNYTENYDIVDENNNPIYPSFLLGYSSFTTTEGLPYNQVKSNRDYEVAIGYLDGKGRVTTPFTSIGNTTYIKNEDCNRRNQLKVTIKSKAPDFATHYRFYIKQSKTSYDTLSPVTFYVDGVYSWLKLEGGDQNKIEVGDFIYVKSDTSGVVSGKPVRVKILEIESKERNFLSPNETVETLQQEGLYFKIKNEGISLDPTAVSIHSNSSSAFRSRSSSGANNITGGQTYVELPIYYGSIGSNDLSVSGTYTGNQDIRYEIEVVSTGGTVDTFRWREVRVSVESPSPTVGDWNDNGGLGIDMTGSPQTLSNGLSINFGLTVNHQSDDAWVVSAKAKAVTDATNRDEGSGSAGGTGRRAIGGYLSKPKGQGNGESIKGGAKITLTYDDTLGDASGEVGKFTDTFIATKAYANLEEWFYGDNIISQFSVYPTTLDRIIFRRGNQFGSSLPERINVDPNGDMIMIIVTSPTFSGGSNCRTNLSIKIEELDNSIILETNPVDTNTDIFYELSDTYPISGGNHQGKTGDTNQFFGILDAVINLSFFNSFGWGNGFESYKIGDSFNAKEMLIDTKPVTPLDTYRQTTRQASLTYGGVYERTTSYNAVNEFNLSLFNFKDMDDAFGSIQKLYSKDTDLYVFQEDKTHRVLYNKTALFDADGNGTIRQSTEVLGQEVAFAGRYGIGLYPESFAAHGTMIYHTDSDSGALLRLGGDGYTEISEAGFQNYFRTLTPQDRFVGGYDPFDDVYMVSVTPTGTANTLTYSERAKGFPVFYSFVPEAILNINNKLYTIKNGQLWLHHDPTAVVNNFYGVDVDARLETVFNDAPNDIKIFKNINIEGDFPWDTTLETNLTSGSILASEYQNLEGEYYAYVRGNEKETYDFTSVSAIQGIGEVQSISLNTITINSSYINESLAEGDQVFRNVSGDTYIVVGTVQSINYQNNTITLDSVEGSTAIGQFLLMAKDMRAEASVMKGYYLKVTMVSGTKNKSELFAINTEVSKSYD